MIKVLYQTNLNINMIYFPKKFMEIMIKTKNILFISSLSLIICILTIEYLAFTSQSIKYVENTWDKANHFIAFFVLYILLYFSHFKFKIKTIILVLLIFAFQIEVVQYFLPNRYFSFLDILADFVGIIMGMIVVYLILKLYPHTIQK